MRLTAIIAARNEALYIGRCCEHLADQGIEFVLIDNESTDDTPAIAESFSNRGLIRVVSHPYPGYFDWIGLLKMKERIAREIDSDWFMHLDADEIPEAPKRGESFITHLARAAADGFTAVNFDEFVFGPATEDERHEGTDYVAGMCNYYFFQPRPERLIRAWKATDGIDLASSGGHAATLPGRRICPESFVLRHYIALSMDHMRRKYVSQRVYAKSELEIGWHRERSQLDNTKLRVPPPDELLDIRTDGGWNRTRPRRRHLFFMAGESRDAGS